MRFLSLATVNIALVFLLSAGSVRPAAAALTVNGYTAATAGKYDRFDSDPRFIGSAYDWSGVGRTAGGYWGVLISPSFILSAVHHPPVDNEEIRFYASNNPADGYQSRTIGLKAPPIVDTSIGVGSDLLLTRLSAPVTGIATYAIGNPADSLVGEELFVWGQSNKADPFLNTRLGRNEVTEVARAFSAPALGASTGDVFVYDYNPTGSGLGADEAKIEVGDSGGPSFVVGPDGTLALVGIHWFNAAPDPAIPGSLGFSGDTLVTSFIDELNTAMSNMGSSEHVTVAVPEPSALGLCVVGFSAVCFRRRSRAQSSSSMAI